jgi:uncharacterized membrane protein YphA (DoxX/SURF4 family)
MLDIIGGIALVLGIRTRAVVLLPVPHLLATLWFVHGAKGLMFSAPGFGLRQAPALDG